MFGGCLGELVVVAFSQRSTDTGSNGVDLVSGEALAAGVSQGKHGEIPAASGLLI